MENKFIAVTGINGVLGKELVTMLEKTNFKILALHHNMEESHILLNERKEHIFALVHCAFARNEGPKQLCESLSFTKFLMELANQLGIPRIINISSKSVYENNEGMEWNEETEVNPKGSYALAKYAAEMIADSCITGSNCKLTHIRLASLIGPGMDQRVVTKLIRRVMEGQDLSITNGEQTFQYMDIRDAAEAIVALLKTDKENWKRIYCVAPRQWMSLKEIAQTIVETCEEEGYPPVNLMVADSGNMCVGYMNANLFYTDTGWKDKYSLKDCVKNIVLQISVEK